MRRPDDSAHQPGGNAPSLVAEPPQRHVAPALEAWATYRSRNAQQWDAAELVRAKAGWTVSVVIPARNEQETVGAIVATIRTHLMERVPLVDELVVVDSDTA